MAKDRLKFDDTDFQLTKLIAVGALIIAAIVSVIRPLTEWANGEPLRVLLDDQVGGTIDGGRPGVTLSRGPDIAAEFANPTAGLWLASIAPSVLFVICLGIIVWLLWRLLDDVRDGHPFTTANVARMRGIAIIIIGGAVALFVVNGLVNGYLISSALDNSATVFSNTTTGSDMLLLGVGFLFAALAEAFKRGVQLEDDVEGLV